MCLYHLYNIIGHDYVTNVQSVANGMGQTSSDDEILYNTKKVVGSPHFGIKPH